MKKVLPVILAAVAILASCDQTSSLVSPSSIPVSTPPDVSTPVLPTTPSSTVDSSTSGPISQPSSTLTPSSTSPISSSSSSSSVPSIVGNISAYGLEDCDSVLGRYFDPFKGVEVYDDEGCELTEYLSVDGYVDFGTEGAYTLTYRLGLENADFRKERIVRVKSGTYDQPRLTPSSSASTVAAGRGSYLKGNGTDIVSPAEPQFIDEELLREAVPTNTWWSNMLDVNYGAGCGLFTNPLRYSFKNDGVEMTDIGAGFTEFMKDQNGDRSAATIALADRDLVFKASSLQGEYETRVVDYSENEIKVALRNSRYGADEMVVNLVQGSPYLIGQTKDSRLDLDLRVGGVTKEYAFYDLHGNRLTGDSYIGDSLIVELPNTLTGFTSDYDTLALGQVYDSRYYLINVPEGSSFLFRQNKHPSPLFKDRIEISLGVGNYFSVNPLNSLSEASFFHDHAFAAVTNTHVDYHVDHETNLVTTVFSNNVQNFRSNATPLIGLMPHQYKISSTPLTSYAFESIRGQIKISATSRFEMVDQFTGLLPYYTLPEGVDPLKTEQYLASLDTLTEETFGAVDENKSGPYWDAKTFYPLAQGIIIADQSTEVAYRDKFLRKAKELLVDWLTYSGPVDEKYLYYNDVYGTMYYSNNDFNTASELNDHHFTHGYLVFTAAVIAMYESAFYTDYRDIILHLLKDYMNWNQEDCSEYPFLRNYDPWAGHSWSAGVAHFAEGNNQESSGEALNSWVAGYLVGLAEGNQDIIDTAIYGYTSEQASIKQYVLNYDGDNYRPEYQEHYPYSGMIWGGKYTYATWFGLNPTFIFGIHFLPLGQYIDGYVQTLSERAALIRLYEKFLELKGGRNDIWQSNMLLLMALFDSTTALNSFDETALLADEYPNDLLATYWGLHALDELGNRTGDITAAASSAVGWTVYKKGDSYKAEVWNPSDQPAHIVFKNSQGETISSIDVPGRTFSRVVL